jgi:hypothetical protein
LVLVVGIMLVLLALGTGTLYCGLQNRLLALHDSEQIVAKAAADAGLKKAVAQMNSYESGPLPSATNEALPGCTASYSYAVTQNQDSAYSATSTGTAGTAVRTVGSKLKGSSALWSAVSLSAEVSLSSTSRIAPVSGSSLKVRTNTVTANGVSLSSNATIQGDVVVGPGGNPATVISDPDRVMGTKSAAPQALSLPAVTPPSGLPNRGSVTISGVETISSDGRYSSLTLKNATVQIQGNVTIYVTGDMTIKSSSTLWVQDGSSLTVYVGGVFSQKGGVIKEVNLQPEKLQIYGTSTCTSIDIGSSGTACAAIYAPAAKCSIGSSSTLVGVFSGKKLELSSSSELRYDAGVDGQCRFGATTYSIDRWWEN